MSELQFTEVGHAYTLNGQPIISVTQALKAAGIVDTTWFTAWARERGSAVHKAIHYHEQDDLDESTLDEDIRPYFDAYLKWKAETNSKCVESELMVMDSVYKFAGTIDQVALRAGEYYVIDFKTGLPSRAVGLQLTGYALALKTSKNIKATRLVAVHLMSDGTYKEKLFPLEISVFHAVLTVAHWQQAK